LFFGNCFFVFRKLFVGISKRLELILEVHKSGWYLSTRERLLKVHKNGEDVEYKVNSEMMDEYFSRLSSEILLEFGEDLGNLLINQGKSFILMKRAIELYQLDCNKVKNNLTKELICKYPIISRDQPWKQYMTNKQFNHNHFYKYIQKHQLYHFNYFINRDFIFNDTVSHF